MFKSYTQLSFVDEKAKVNVSYYVTKLLPNLIKARLQASPVGQLHLSARWRTCSHSSSCLRLDREEMPWFHWKKRMATEFARIPLDYHDS